MCNKGFPTEQAAFMLGLKRQEFLVLKRFFGIQPYGTIRLTGKTPANLYMSQDVEHLLDLKRRCHANGLKALK
jgi:hypothetical protein